MHESCGKCTPCREGTRWMVSLLEKIESGRAEHSDLDLLRNICDRVGGQVALRARRLRRLARQELHRQVPRRVRGAHRPGRLPVRRRVVDRRRRRPGRPAHAFPGRRGAGVTPGPVPRHVSNEGLSLVTGWDMSAAELVTVSIDGREVQVPKGTGLVETALAAGIEIPVFCYEPRLGPPIGACRMCLVEVEGMPKLQAGCTLTAADGMVVRTAQTSPDGGRRTELDPRVHPRQPPARLPGLRQGRRVPAPGPDVPLGAAGHAQHVPEAHLREADPDLADDRSRPRALHPLLPLHALLLGRGRGRASSSPATVARSPIIATFEDEPYRAPFSGNVIELCPVGALTSTQYRFEARPWEIQDVPTVCGLCPVGCNIEATTREGKVKRIVSRNHPRSTRAGSATRAGSGSRTSAPTTGSSTPAGERGAAATRRSPGTTRSTRRSRCSERPGTSIVTALSGSETGEQAYALGKLLRQGLDAHCAVMPEDVSPALDAFRLPLSAIREAELIVVLGDDPVVERAPIVDLWIKAARRAGAELVESEIGTPDGGVAMVRDELGSRIRALDRAILIWSGPDPSGGATVAALAGELGLADKPGSGAFHLLDTANGRGVADAWAAAADARPDRPGADRAADRLGRRGRGEPGRARARRAGRRGSSRSRCSGPRSPAGPTSSSPARAISSATGHT